MKKDARGNIKLPIPLHKELAHVAVDEGISLAEVVARLFKRHRQWSGRPHSTSSTSTIPSQLMSEIGDRLSLADLTSGERKWLETLVQTGVDLLKSAPGRASEQQDLRSSEPDDIDTTFDPIIKKANEAVALGKKRIRTEQPHSGDADGTGSGGGENLPEADGGGAGSKVKSKTKRVG